MTAGRINALIIVAVGRGSQRVLNVENKTSTVWGVKTYSAATRLYKTSRTDEFGTDTTPKTGVTPQQDLNRLEVAADDNKGQLTMRGLWQRTSPLWRLA